MGRCRDSPPVTPVRSQAMSSSSPAAEMSRHDASQLFNLKWKNYQNHLIQVFDKMLVTESFADVTLVCCDTDHETTQAIKAHKMILGASSPYFEIVFAEHPCQHPVVVMPPEVRVEDLQHVLQFIYKGEVQVSLKSRWEKPLLCSHIYPTVSCSVMDLNDLKPKEEKCPALKIIACQHIS